MNKSKLKWIIVGLVVGALIMVIVTERLFAPAIHSRNMISTTEELSQRITLELMDGKSRFITYVYGMTDDQLVGINHNLDGFLGHVSSYTMLRKVNNNVMQVSFDLEVSDNYYVYQNIVNGMDISAYVQAQVMAKKVRQIMDECRSESEYQTVVNYHDYIVHNTAYGFLTGEEEQYSYKAYGALLRNKAVCNGYAEAMELLLLCSGLDTYMVVGNTTEGAHAWNIVKIDGEWYHVDTTWDDPLPDMGESGLHMYLNVDDTTMQMTHNWNEEAYPECTSMDMNYYTKENIAFSSVESLNNYLIDSMKPGTQCEVMTSGINLTETNLEMLMQKGDVSSASWQRYGEGQYTIVYINYE